jgi:Uncharacterized conserved protein (COG2071)
MTMRLPTMRGTIERRLLVNYRVDPAVLQAVLPEPFRPWLVDDCGVAGICLIRLGSLRPVGLPAWIGPTTENAAHRIAVEWDSHNGIRRGVFIPRRDTSSRVTHLVGGRLFPGEHHHADFRVREDCTNSDVSFASDDGAVCVSVSVRETRAMPRGSVFESLAQASAFFRQGSLGYSATHRATEADGLELSCDSWNLRPALVEHVESTFFDDQASFPRGSTVVDSAFVMRDLDATWHAQEPLALRPRRRLPARH